MLRMSAVSTVCFMTDSDLFADEKRSVQYLEDHAAEFLSDSAAPVA